MTLLRVYIAIIFLIISSLLFGACSDNAPTQVEDDFVRFEITNVSIDPEVIAPGDTVTFTATVTGNRNLISSFRWRIIDVTSEITDNEVYVWVADLPPGNYRGEVRPRSNAQVAISSYWFDFSISSQE